MPIICGTDLSAGSLRAVEVARALASQRNDAAIVLVYAVEEERDAPTSRAKLDAFAASAPAHAVSIRTELVVGAPEEALVNFAETEGSDLIVIAASSSPAHLIRLGSTAEKLIVASRVPVLVVRDPKPWVELVAKARPLRVLLGVDDSVACDLGIQWTHALRSRGPVEVVLGAIYYPDDAAEHYGIESKDVVERDPAIEQLITRDLLRRFGATDGVEARTQRGLGRIGDHVVELAKSANVDAIVIGTTQKTGLGRLGSVSSIVVHDAVQSVICVPPNASVPTMFVPRLASALVATDLSTFANRAVPFAFALTDEGGDVHIAHVVDDDAVLDEPEVLRSLAALAPQSMQRTVSSHILRGSDPARTIAQAAARLGVDAICIASHGPSGIPRALVGPVPDRPLPATRKPVLVLRPA